MPIPPLGSCSHTNIAINTTDNPSLLCCPVHPFSVSVHPQLLLVTRPRLQSTPRIRKAARDAVSALVMARKKPGPGLLFSSCFPVNTVPGFPSRILVRDTRNFFSSLAEATICLKRICAESYFRNKNDNVHVCYDGGVRAERAQLTGTLGVPGRRCEGSPLSWRTDGGPTTKTSQEVFFQRNLKVMSTGEI